MFIGIDRRYLFLTHFFAFLDNIMLYAVDDTTNICSCRTSFKYLPPSLDKIKSTNIGFSWKLLDLMKREPFISTTC